MSETPAVTGAYGLASGDFDGDKRPDLAVTSLATSPGTMSVLLNPAPAVATPTPTPTATATPLPTPVAGKSVNVVPEGKVKVKLKGKKTFVTIDDPTQIPVGSEVDTKSGRVTITTVEEGRERGLLRRHLQAQPDQGQEAADDAHAVRGAELPEGQEVSAKQPPRSPRRGACGAAARATSGRPASTARRRFAARSGS